MNFLRDNFITRFFKGVTRNLRNVSRGVKQFSRTMRGTGGATTNRKTSNTGKSKYGKNNGLKSANKNNVDKTKVKDTGYIKGVDSFAPKEAVVQPIYQYQYSNNPDNINLGEDSLGSPTLTDSTQEPDLWEEETTSTADDDFFNEKINELSQEDLVNRKEVLAHYIEVFKSLDTEGGKVVYDIQKQVSDLLLFSDITHVPAYINQREEYTRIVKEKVNVDGIPKEEVGKYIDEELKRYTSVINDFVPIITRDGKYFIDDWKVGIKAIDFMVKDVKFPEYLILLTGQPLNEVANAMSEGYLPPVLQHTPFKKVLTMFERLAEDIERKSNGNNYQFPKAYREYKKSLPLYKKLRNNGKFPNVSLVLNDFYRTIDEAHVNDAYQGDAYLGLIEQQEFIASYTKFFYGGAKQTQAMSDFTVRLMKQNENILKEMTDNNYTLADKPEGSFIVFAGHIVTFVPVKGDNYVTTIDKAPSDITGDDIKELAGMVSKAKKTPPKKKTESKPVPKKPENEFGLSYDYDGAMSRINKLKKK